MSAEIRDAVEGDAAQLLALRRQLFAETEFMLWELSEFNATVGDERQYIRGLLTRANSQLLVADAGSTLVGFTAAIGGERNRLRHSALLVLGVVRDFWSKGIGSRMLSEIIAWAPSADLKRLELTVHTTNDRRLRSIVGMALRWREREGVRSCSKIDSSMSISCP